MNQLCALDMIKTLMLGDIARRGKVLQNKFSKILVSKAFRRTISAYEKIRLTLT